MGYWVRAMKRQLLVASLFVMLLAPSVTLLTFITYYGKHFTVINDVSLEKNPYRIFHSVAFFTGMCLSSILIIAGLLCIVATVRELEGAMAMGFFCFAVVFCASVQAVHWTITSSTKVRTDQYERKGKREGIKEMEIYQLPDKAKINCLF